MSEVHGLMPDYRFPRSRDWGMDDAPPCRVTKCSANFAGECVSPAAIKIGDDGKCEGIYASLKEPSLDGHFC